MCLLVSQKVSCEDTDFDTSGVSKPGILVRGDREVQREGEESLL